MRILWSSVLGNGVFAPWLVKLNYGVRMWSSREAEVCVYVCLHMCHAHTLHSSAHPILRVHCTPLHSHFPLTLCGTRLGNFSNIFLLSYTHFSMDFPFSGKMSPQHFEDLIKSPAT